MYIYCMKEMQSWDMPLCTDLPDFIRQQKVKCEVVDPETQGLNIVQLPNCTVRVDCFELEKKLSLRNH